MININFKAGNIQPNNIEAVSGFVYFVVRTHELNRVSTAIKDAVETIETAHPGCDALTIDEKSVKEALTDKTESFLKLRSEAVALKKELNNLPTMEDYNALLVVDKVFITLLAHQITPAIKLGVSVVEGMGLNKLISSYYTKGSLKEVKNTLKAIFHKAVGQDGSLFYGIRLKKSDFSDSDVRNFLAYFRGTAAARKSKDADGNPVVGSYDWVKKESHNSAQVMAITNLFSVILASRIKDYERNMEGGEI